MKATNGGLKEWVAVLWSRMPKNIGKCRMRFAKNAGIIVLNATPHDCGDKKRPYIPVIGVFYEKTGIRDLLKISKPEKREIHGTEG